jgi:single-stranded-DNA-specific exonuclease
MLIPEIEIDAEIDFADITPKLTRILKQNLLVR